MIGIVGISHQKTPIEIRERLAISADAAPALLKDLIESPAIDEVFVLSTCNRVEVVVACDENEGRTIRHATDQVKRRLLESAPEVEPYIYVHENKDAVKHLFRVAASLDSLVVGEPQILGQVKEAFETARKARALGSALHRVMGQAIHTAKRVRSETAIGAGQVSIPSIAVDLARQIFGELSACRAMLVGSGEMAETTARLLRAQGAQIFVVGRNQARVEELSQTVAGTPRMWHELKATLAEANVVITSTSARSFVMTRELVEQTRRAQRWRSLFCIDLAVPRDVEPAVERVDGVFLYNVDDLSRVVHESLKSRQREAELAETIVAEEASGFERWAKAEQATPTIVALRERVRLTLQGELQRSLSTKLKHLSQNDRESLELMLEAAVKKLMHEPIRRLRQGAVDRSLEGSPLHVLLSSLDELFALTNATVESSRRRSRAPSQPPEAGQGGTPEDAPAVDDDSSPEQTPTPDGALRAQRLETESR